jgi:hypothetical protein
MKIFLLSSCHISSLIFKNPSGARSKPDMQRKKEVLPLPDDPNSTVKP